MDAFTKAPAGADSRERILEAATRLFVEQGYRGLSMREIAEAVELSKPAIYHYFGDKEELFLAILNRYLDHIGRKMAAADAMPGTACERIELIVRGILTEPAEQRSIQRLASAEMVHLSEVGRKHFHERYQALFLGPIQAVIAEGVKDGELRPIDPVVATWALLGMLYPYFTASSTPAPSSAIIEQVVGIYLHGVESK